MAAANAISFKDLCIDAVNPEVLATFWASALGLRAEPSGADFRLVDDVPEHTLWVNEVPEPRTVKQRVHLDVDVSAVSDLTDLGAVIIDDTQSWTVLADPEGGELCAFVREPESLPTIAFTRWSSTLRIRSRLRPGGRSATPPTSVMIKTGPSPGSIRPRGCRGRWCSNGFRSPRP